MDETNRPFDGAELFSSANLDASEKAVLDRINEIKKQLVFGFAPTRWLGLLCRNTFARAVRASNSIEGYEISNDDAVAAVEGEEPIDPKTENWWANVGYRRAMTLVLQKASSPHFRYSTELLDSLHFMMLDYDLSKNPGNWRRRSIYVADSESGELVYEAPSPELVPRLMARLVAALNEESGTPPLVRSALAHLNLVMIHPYSDGNGRMGRCLQTLVLARAGTVHPMFGSIEEYLGRNTEDYYRVLAGVGAGSWQPHRDTRVWVRFNLTAHFRQATTLLRRSGFYMQLFEFLEGAVKSVGLPDRAAQALADAVLGYRVRNATYRKLADVEMRTAGRDLKRLVAEDLLTARGRKRGQYYVASQKLKQMTSDIERPRRVDDPFQLLASGRALPG